MRIIKITPTVSADEIKAEAHRRIIAVCPEWKQRNLTAQAAILSEKGRANWDRNEKAAWDAGAALWGQIAAIRAASGKLEDMSPVPADYDDDKWWPE